MTTPQEYDDLAERLSGAGYAAICLPLMIVESGTLFDLHIIEPDGSKGKWVSTYRYKGDAEYRAIANPQHVKELCEEYTALRAERDAAVEALRDLANAKALAGVRGLVAGWNGEGNPDGPYDRHPEKLGATIPKTNCGAIYELDEALTRAASLASKKPAL